MVRTVVVAFGMAASVLVAAEARADDSAEARALFDRGYAALMTGRFPEARDLLRESLETQARPATAFNLVLALLGTEEPLAAGEVCEGLLGRRYGTIDGAHRREAADECARANREAGTVVITVSGAGDDAHPAVRVDAAVVAAEASADGTLSVRVDPGTHVVSAGTRDGRSVDERVTVGRGQTVRVALPLPPSLAERESRADDRDGPPWLLIGVGVGLVVVGVVIAIAIALATTSGNGMNEPISDPVWGVTMALR